MSTKKVQIGARPTGKADSVTADAWVENRGASDASGQMKRLTIDVPESLHRSIKTACAMRGTKIADEVRDLLVRHYAQATAPVEG